MAIDSETDR